MLSINSKSGFSLVELMVTVAIVGLLASVAIPQYRLFVGKSRQSEAKVGLSSIYTAEKAFFTEYGTYHTSLVSIGYSPTGLSRYNVGFGTQTASNGNYVPPANVDLSLISTGQVCQTPSSAGVPNNGCIFAEEPWPVDAGLTAHSMGFAAGAFADHEVIFSRVEPGSIHVPAVVMFAAPAMAHAQSNGDAADLGPVFDAWTIDENKNFISFKASLGDDSKKKGGGVPAAKSGK